MNKIKVLLEKAGCNQELVDSICEALEGYKDSLRDQFASEYQTRIEQAKKVCVEETEEHKRELARRVQIFCETKAAAIEAQLAKQSALSESEAVTKLKNIVSLLEGVEHNGTNNGRSTAALEKAKLKIQQVNEEKQRAVEVANRQIAISEKALKENRRLATQVSELKRQMTEGTVARHNPSQRIDESRKNGRTSTTRPTILENQDRKVPAKRVTVTAIPTNKTLVGIADIAANMDEDLI